MRKRSIIKLFESRKGNLDVHLNRDYVQNGIITIPYRISSYDDIISQYSIKGYETLNLGFADKLKTEVEFVPPEFPIVLNIIGGGLSQAEKKIIVDTILDTFAYELGMVEKEEKRHIKVFILMTIGLILSGILLYYTHSLAEEPREMLFIMYWFIGYTICDYIFLTGRDLRMQRWMAGRIASVKVVFSEQFEDPNYTETDVDNLYSEIEKDVQESIWDDD